MGGAGRELVSSTFNVAETPSSDDVVHHRLHNVKKTARECPRTISGNVSRKQVNYTFASSFGLGPLHCEQDTTNRSPTTLLKMIMLLRDKHNGTSCPNFRLSRHLLVAGVLSSSPFPPSQGQSLPSRDYYHSASSILVVKLMPHTLLRGPLISCLFINIKRCKEDSPS